MGRSSPHRRNTPPRPLFRRLHYEEEARDEADPRCHDEAVRDAGAPRSGALPERDDGAVLRGARMLRDGAGERVLLEWLGEPR